MNHSWLWMYSSKVAIERATVRNIVFHKLQYQKICCQWVPGLNTTTQQGAAKGFVFFFTESSPQAQRNCHEERKELLIR